MALDIGDEEAKSGMAKAIYKALEDQLNGSLDGIKEEKDKDEIKKGWEKLSYAIAYGVISHIKDNMEISDITDGPKLCQPPDKTQNNRQQSS
jgi:hypothetical protein